MCYTNLAKPITQPYAVVSVWLTVLNWIVTCVTVVVYGFKYLLYSAVLILLSLLAELNKDCIENQLK